VVCDLQGNILETNASYNRLTGFSAEELGRMNLRDLVTGAGGEEPARGAALIERLLEASSQTGGERAAPRLEMRHLTKGGEALEVEISGAMIDRASGRIRIFFRDLSGQKQTEASLLEAKERYRAFVEHSQTGIFRIDFTEPVPTSLPLDRQIKLCFERGFISECTDSMARMYGHERAEDLIGKTMRELFVETDPANELFIRNFLISGYQLTDGESHERDKYGNDKYFLNTLSGVVEESHLVRVWGSQRDVTERKNVQTLRRSSSRASVIFTRSSTSRRFRYGCRTSTSNASISTSGGSTFAGARSKRSSTAAGAKAFTRKTWKKPCA
jgi:PAS domain S-box-containing protein